MEVVNEDVANEASEQNEARVEDVEGELGVIEVEVLLASGERDFDIAEVEVKGTTDAGEASTAVISEHTDGLFRLENVPAGDYTGTARSQRVSDARPCFKVNHVRYGVKTIESIRFPNSNKNLSPDSNQRP